MRILRTNSQSILYFFGSHDFDRRPEVRVDVHGGSAVLYLFDSFRCSFFFNFALLASKVQINSPVFPFRSRSRKS